MSELTPIERVHGCAAILVNLLMKETNAATVTMKLEGLAYNDTLLGDYKLTITEVTPKVKAAHKSGK